MRSVELFSGAGGLALGVARAGFKHQLLVEKDDRARETLIFNRDRGVEHVRDWHELEEDARLLDYGDFEKDVDLVAGGPPCQPFSIGGKHGGPSDYRDLWPEAIRAVRELEPKAFLFENVRGLTRPSFSEYLRYICLHLEWPSLAPRDGESWIDHSRRLERHARGSRKTNFIRYQVYLKKINAADHGVPQKRHRVFIVGFRVDLGIRWEFPPETHSRERLVWDQWVTGDYWREREIPGKDRPGPASRDAGLVTKLIKRDVPPEGKPWVTVRDAIGDLPEPRAGDGNESCPNHRFQPGARVYVGHTGSPLDQPAKALKAGDHGVPGGENMLVRPDGSVRYFTVREAARLQGFPDDFCFPGSWTTSLRQIGNAVPVNLAETIAKEMARSLESARESNGRRQAA